MTEHENTAIVEILQENGLDKNNSQAVLQEFQDFLTRVKELEDQAKAIVVTDPSQTAKMLEAKELRLNLRDIRISAEKVRKEKKDFFLRGGRAIDGAANILKSLIVPLEEHLEKQEKFVELQEEARKNKQESERITRLAQYVDDVSVFNLRDMTDEAFEILLKNAKSAFDSKKEAEQKAAEEEKARLEAKEEEDKKIREENEKLAKEKAEADKKAQEAEKAKKKAEDELRAKEAEEARKKAEEEDRKKAEAKAKKQAKYRDYRSSLGWTEETKGDYKEENTGSSIVIWKKIGEFELE